MIFSGGEPSNWPTDHLILVETNLYPAHMTMITLLVGVIRSATLEAERASAIEALQSRTAASEAQDRKREEAFREVQERLWEAEEKLRSRSFVSGMPNGTPQTPPAPASPTANGEIRFRV